MLAISLNAEANTQPATDQQATTQSAACQPKLTDTVSRRSPPDIRINGVNLESRLNSTMVLPSRPLEIEYYARNLTKPLIVKPSEVTGRNKTVLQQTSDTHWRYQPDTKQHSHLDLCADGFSARLLLWPAVEQKLLQRQYPSSRLSPSATAYATPSHFLSVTSKAMANRRLSEHFRLHQFLANPADKSANSSGGWPKYTLISFALLEKLELVIDVLAAHGKPAATLQILSSYRSPSHNARVGGARYSRHIYGDAVDFIVDTNFDGKMDDLNDDGATTRADLDWLTDRLARRSVPVSSGGTGSYESAGNAAAFLHLDTRGRDHYWQ